MKMEQLILDISNFFEQEEDYYKPVRRDNFWVTTILNIKVMVIEIKHYRLKNILAILEHT